MQLNYEQAKALLDRAVAEKGADYVYPDTEKYPWNPHRDPMCSYYTKDEGAPEVRPSCIIGMVIDYLGLRAKFLAQRERYEGESGVAVLRELGVTLTEKADTLLDRTQGGQDAQENWGNAVELAVSEADSFPDEVIN